MKKQPTIKIKLYFLTLLLTVSHCVSCSLQKSYVNNSDSKTPNQTVHATTQREKLKSIMDTLLRKDTWISKAFDLHDWTPEFPDLFCDFSIEKVDSLICICENWMYEIYGPKDSTLNKCKLTPIIDYNKSEYWEADLSKLSVYFSEEIADSLTDVIKKGIYENFNPNDSIIGIRKCPTLWQLKQPMALRLLKVFNLGEPNDHQGYGMVRCDNYWPIIDSLKEARNGLTGRLYQLFEITYGIPIHTLERSDIDIGLKQNSIGNRNSALFLKMLDMNGACWYDMQHNGSNLIDSVIYEASFEML